MTPDQQFSLGVTAVMLPELDFDEQLQLCHELSLSNYVYRPRIIPDQLRAEPYSNWGNHRFDLTPERLAAHGGKLREQVVSSGIWLIGIFGLFSIGSLFCQALADFSVQQWGQRVKTSVQPDDIPSSVSGSVIRRNRFQADAPRSAAASLKFRGSFSSAE